MILKLLLFFCLAFAEVTPYIVGGEPAQVDEFPFAASLKTKIDSHLCGGVLIDPSWVLTAAHCMAARSGLKVVHGILNLADQNEQNTAVIEKFFIHPQYQSWPTNFDIALVKLAKPVSTPFIELNQTALDESLVQELTVIGWGHTLSRGTSEVLLKVKVPHVAQEKCKSSYPNRIFDNMICAGYDSGGKDACQGDSGGPLFTNGSHPKLVGIVSWGQGCARPGKYGVYSRVSFFIDWINNTIQNN